METSISKIDLSQYGLEETKAAEIRKDFDAVLKIATELEADYNVIIGKSETITPELVKESKLLRIKYMKVRTGISAVHKERKAFYLSGGRAVDGLKNAYTHAVEGNEKKLKEIETHFECIEQERVDKLQNDRVEALEEFKPDFVPDNLWMMDSDVWGKYLASIKENHRLHESAAKIAKAERIAKGKRAKDKQKRIKDELKRLKIEADARDKAEAKRQAKVDADNKRIEDERAAERAEADAKIADSKAKSDKLEADAKAKADEEAKEKADAIAREQDVEHHKKINNAAVLAIEGLGFATEQGKRIVVAIAKGEIANVSISY